LQSHKTTKNWVDFLLICENKNKKLEFKNTPENTTYQKIIKKPLLRHFLTIKITYITNKGVLNRMKYLDRETVN